MNIGDHKPLPIFLCLLWALSIPPVYAQGNAYPAQVHGDVRILGEEWEDFLGVSVASGDLNGDGVDDLIVTAPTADPPGREDAGKAYVFYGGCRLRFQAGLPSVIDLRDTQADVTVYGSKPYDRLGHFASTGDVNGDGMEDLILSAYFADPLSRIKAGETYVIYGGSALPSVMDLRETPADLTVYGEGVWDLLGHSVASGDVNGDGFDDVIIGAIYAPTPGGGGAGKTYVIYGGSDLPAVIDLSSTPAGLTVYGDDEGDLCGNWVASGDLNADEYDDVLIGAIYADAPGGRDAGKAYVVYGGPDLPPVLDLDQRAADLTVYGDDESDLCGKSVASGDLNGDGFDDLIVGAVYADPPGGEDGGETYILYGGTHLPPVIDLDQSRPDVVIYGEHAGDQAGYFVFSADMNSDGFDDLFIGATHATVPNGQPAGKVYVLYGGLHLPPIIDLHQIQADLTLYGQNRIDEVGQSIGAGDLNGDGTDDLIVGADGVDREGADGAGEAYVIYGQKQRGITMVQEHHSVGAQTTFP